MLAFRRVTEHKAVERDQVYEKMGGVPGVVVDGLLARFSEVPRGSTGYVFRQSHCVLAYEYLIADTTRRQRHRHGF